ncbi:creatininase family protein [Aestuariicoccus sp. MJ-SS9]|uniref:creatininase family protein n=1 Tax=Aestuariicoccus sp. MJ-SS9 TaxID=3079855 RepID=UPI00290A7AA3|nr:creatininase family protein [Aestuariicoccus sp. MJ-SS9]MDU8913543.1 creatininase family protein [Aestuariicoccus sp. MJ-SS9]
MTWPEVEERIRERACVMLPTGSTEQHGPIGLIGTDTLCADNVALAAARLCNGIVAPPIAYTPAPFNTAFPGTVSVSRELFANLLGQVCKGLLDQGFQGVFIVNGHGANLDPAHQVAGRFAPGAIHIQSWWEPRSVAALREEMFGAWEGMHATPSEVAITQALYGQRVHPDAVEPPERLSADYIRAHAGDRHGPPDEHRALFPDGRVGSHSALASPEKGGRILDVAAQALAQSFTAFSARRTSAPS